MKNGGPIATVLMIATLFGLAPATAYNTEISETDYILPDLDGVSLEMAHGAGTAKVEFEPNPGCSPGWFGVRAVITVAVVATPSGWFYETWSGGNDATFGHPTFNSGHPLYQVTISDTHQHRVGAFCVQEGSGQHGVLYVDVQVWESFPGNPGPGWPVATASGQCHWGHPGPTCS